MKEFEFTIPGIDVEASRTCIARKIDESGFTDKEIAEIMGLTVQAINKWRKMRSLPDIENLFILSRILGVKVDDFLVQRKNTEEAGGFPASSAHRLWVYYFHLYLIN